METELPRFLIVSMPKSGTHLLSGMISTMLESEFQPYYFSYNSITKKYCVQMEENKFGGNRASWVNFKKSYPFAFNKEHFFSDPELLLYLIRPGEVAISHLSRREIPVILDPGFVYIYVLRDIEGIIASTFNTERKIVLLNPELRDLFYSDINFSEPTENDISKFVMRAFDNLAPHFLEMLYWQFTTKSCYTSYQDIICKSDRLLAMMEKIGNYCNKKVSVDSWQTDNFYQTKLTNDDQKITPAKVKELLDSNVLFGLINDQILSVLGGFSSAFKF